MVTVPNVIGMNLTDANATLANKGLNYVLAGASTQRETAIVQINPIQKEQGLLGEQ